MELPSWIRVRLPQGNSFEKIKTSLRKHQLVTVCEEAHCPNRAECWQGESTATFMLMGDTCTRGCRFCTVTHGKSKILDHEEPQKLAEAIAEIGLDYAVLTSVTRDDLPDGGAAHIAKCITAIHHAHPDTLVEVLIPDFQGNEKAVQCVIHARPTVIAHNIETVERLQARVRDRRASYAQSLRVLQSIKETNPAIYTKSSLMVGLGETDNEIEQAMHDLRAAGVDIITIGQYLRPTSQQMPVQKYYRPEEFKHWEEKARSTGFLFGACGPLVRSSYRAGELFIKHVMLGGDTGEESLGHV